MNKSIKNKEKELLKGYNEKSQFDAKEGFPATFSTTDPKLNNRVYKEQNHLDESKSSAFDIVNSGDVKTAFAEKTYFDRTKRSAFEIEKTEEANSTFRETTYSDSVPFSNDDTFGPFEVDDLEGLPGGVNDASRGDSVPDIYLKSDTDSHYRYAQL